MSIQTAPTFTHIIKRDGGIKPFDAGKIAQALERAAQVTGEFDGAEARRLTQYLVTPKIRILGPATPHIEQIQDAVEAALFDAGYPKTLRATSSTASNTRSCAATARRWWTSSPA